MDKLKVQLPAGRAAVHERIHAGMRALSATTPCAVTTTKSTALLVCTYRTLSSHSCMQAAHPYQPHLHVQTQNLQVPPHDR